MKGQLKTCNAIGGCIPPNFTFTYWLNAFSPAAQLVSLWMPGGSGAECSDAVLYSCPAVEPLLWMPGGSGAGRVLSCSIVLLIWEMQLPVISCWLLSYLISVKYDDVNFKSMWAVQGLGAPVVDSCSCEGWRLVQDLP